MPDQFQKTFLLVRWAALIYTYEGCPNKSWILLITHDCVAGILFKLL